LAVHPNAAVSAADMHSDVKNPHPVRKKKRDKI